MLTIYAALQPKSDVGRLYIPRKVGGRGSISIEDCAELSIGGLEVYVHGSEERLIQAGRVDKIDGKIRRLGGESCTWSVFEGD